MEKDVTRNIEEQLSAFLDGELAEAELQLLVRRLEREPAYRDTLSRYAAIGSVMRGDPVATMPGALRGSFRADLMDEVEADAAPEVAVEAIAAPRASRRALGGAIAASVALVAAFGLYQGSNGIDTVPLASTPTEAPQVASANVGSFAAPAAASQRSPAAARADRSGFVRARATLAPDRMTSYLVSHGEFSRTYHGPMVDSRVFVQPARFDER